MVTVSFEVSDQFLEKGLELYPNMSKNSDVCKLGILMVKEFFIQKNDECIFLINKSGIDLKLILSSGKERLYEIKATADPGIAWSKLKVSSTFCYKAFQNGMEIIRICNVGKTNMEINFMTYGTDFDLIPEARWSLARCRM